MGRINKASVVFGILLLADAVFADSNDFFTNMQNYSTIFAAIGLSIVGGYSALKYMKTEDPLAKKDAMETLIYAVVGATIVIMAPMISGVLSP